MGPEVFSSFLDAIFGKRIGEKLMECDIICQIVGEIQPVVAELWFSSFTFSHCVGVGDTSTAVHVERHVTVSQMVCTRIYIMFSLAAGQLGFLAAL